MRNFSFISNAAHTFHSSNCGDEYLSGDPAEVVEDVIRALARGFESPVEVVRDEFRRVWAVRLTDSVGGLPLTESNGFSYDSLLPPSEVKVLVELEAFYALAKARFENYYDHKTGTIAFSYSNLNTGRSVVWVSSLT